MLQSLATKNLLGLLIKDGCFLFQKNTLKLTHASSYAEGSRGEGGGGEGIDFLPFQSISSYAFELKKRHTIMCIPSAASASRSAAFFCSFSATIASSESTSSLKATEQ